MKYNIVMKNVEIRELGIRILDSPDGVEGRVFELLSEMLKDAGCQDVLDQVDVDKDRKSYYIGEDWASEQLELLKKEYD